MLQSAFADIETWVFDLDNTLYPPEMRLFDQIEVKMTHWVMQTASVDHTTADMLRSSYWQKYGTTLAGLMAEHDIDAKAFLEDVHDIDFNVLSPDPILRAQIEALPGRKIIYTNGTAPYAGQVIAHRGLDGLFDAIYGVEHASLRPKPNRAAFQEVFARDGLTPGRSVMFEDEARNLEAPYAMGMRTVHVAPEPLSAPYIHHHTDDLSGFLKQVMA